MREKIITISLLICVAFTCIQASAKNYYFKNLGMTDGLPQTTVNAILQDKKGFMYFGTK